MICLSAKSRKIKVFPPSKFLEIRNRILALTYINRGKSSLFRPRQIYGYSCLVGRFVRAYNSCFNWPKGAERMRRDSRFIYGFLNVKYFGNASRSCDDYAKSNGEGRQMLPLPTLGQRPHKSTGNLAAIWLIIAGCPPHMVCKRQPNTRKQSARFLLPGGGDGEGRVVVQQQ